jgi:ribitol-5-phosphate 2-dehydrogenase (NADP+)
LVTIAWNTTQVYRLTQPFRIEAVEREVRRERPDDLVLRPRLTGVCASDLKLYAGTRERQSLSRKLPLALLHEGIAEVVEAGTGAVNLRPGTRVVVVPNIPCYVAHPARYPSKTEGCLACRPGGAGENYCLDNLYLSSNTDGLAQTFFRHPASLVVPVPRDIRDRHAVLTEPLTAVVAGCQEAPIRPGARYLILGDGPLAQLVAIWLAVFYRVEPAAIAMTTHQREHPESVKRLVGSLIDVSQPNDLAPLADSIDVVFECVGGTATQATLEQAITCLRPGGTTVLFGPSEHAVPFNTREVIAKGLVFRGCNRSFVPHFQLVIDQLANPLLQDLLETVPSPDDFYVRSADDLNRALYHAWTKRDAGKTLIAWAGPE